MTDGNGAAIICNGYDPMSHDSPKSLVWPEPFCLSYFAYISATYFIFDSLNDIAFVPDSKVEIALLNFPPKEFYTVNILNYLFIVCSVYIVIFFMVTWIEFWSYNSKIVDAMVSKGFFTDHVCCTASS